MERSLGGSRTVSVGYQYLRGREPADAGQPERADLRGGGHEQRLPAESRPTGTTASTPRSASRTITACTSRSCSGRRWSRVRVTYTLSKSMNNLGEAFFSSPIDPTDIKKDWGRSDDDQRHRLVINGSVNTSMTPATTRGSTSATDSR